MIKNNNSDNNNNSNNNARMYSLCKEAQPVTNNPIVYIWNKVKFLNLTRS